MTLATAAATGSTRALSNGIDEERAGPPPAASPVTRPERVSSIDVLRGFALLGILMANIDSFSQPEFLHYIPVGAGIPAFVGPHAHLNLIVLLLKFAFFENKMRGLFSLLFGAGVILFTGRAERRGWGEKSADTFLRRNMWLAVFGILHGTLLWRGDILLMYGLIALLVVYVCRNLKPKTLLIAGTMAWAVIATLAYLHNMHAFETIGLAQREAVIMARQQAGRPLTAEEKKTQQEWQVAVAPMKVDSGEVQKEIATHTQGYRAYVWNEGSKFWKACFTAFALGVSLDSIGAMLVGMALFKIGFLSAELPSTTYLWTALIGFLISIPLSVVSVLKTYSSGFSALSMDKWIYSSVFPAAEAGTVAIAATIVLLYKSGVFRLLLQPFAAVGRTALSNYLLTSLLCEWIFRFGPWKLYGKLEYYQATFVVFAVWAINLIVSPLWLRAFEFGPFEWLWRSLTYWKLQPMRLRS